MRLLKAKQIREMTKEERAAKLRELENELLIARGKADKGAGGKDAGRVISLRVQVARLKTVIGERDEV